MENPEAQATLDTRHKRKTNNNKDTHTTQETKENV
jgi:hypothetical protein